MKKATVTNKNNVWPNLYAETFLQNSINRNRREKYKDNWEGNRSKSDFKMYF